jgi:Domain of unknown function (DUF4129)
VSRSRLVPLAVAVTLLLALVAIASRGRPLRSGGGGKGGLPLSFWDYVFTTSVIVLALLLLALGVAALFIRQAPGKPPSTLQNNMIRTIAFFTLVAIVGTFLARHHLFKGLHIHPPSGQDRLSPKGSGSGVRQTTANRAPQIRWDEIATVLGIFLVAAVVYATLRTRRVPRLFGGDAPDALTAALDESIDDLRADPDLRRAIIAAYARMEAALGAAGIPRRPSEAPLEYVERALLTLHASAGAVRRLTELFEWARFSDHEPEPSMRDEAIDALLAVRDELHSSELIPA